MGFHRDPWDTTHLKVRCWGSEWLQHHGIFTAQQRYYRLGSSCQASVCQHSRSLDEASHGGSPVGKPWLFQYQNGHPWLGWSFGGVPQHGNIQSFEDDSCWKAVKIPTFSWVLESSSPKLLVLFESFWCKSMVKVLLLRTSPRSEACPTLAFQLGRSISGGALMTSCGELWVQGRPVPTCFINRRVSICWHPLNNHWENYATGLYTIDANHANSTHFFPQKKWWINITPQKVDLDS